MPQALHSIDLLELLVELAVIWVVVYVAYRFLRGTRGAGVLRGFAVLLVLFILVLYTPPLRRFFDFTAPGVEEWAIVLPAVVAAMVGQYLISHRWREIVGWVMRDPGGGKVQRGRQI